MKKLLLTAALAFGLSLAAQQAPAPLAKGERVMFLGDSITHGGHYVSFLQLFQALRHPDRPVEIINAGISGQSAPGGIRRLDHDVFPQNPDRVFIMFGMNDVGRHNYASNTPDEKTLKNRERALAAYRKNMTELVDKLLAAGKQVVLILPSPYDQYGGSKTRNLAACNEPGLATCAAIAKKLAAEKKLAVVDFHTPMTALLKKFPEKNLCGGDRVHPGQPGHFIMAALVLKALGETPLVAETVIHADKASAETKNATVTDFRKENGGIRFTYTPACLPYPATGYYKTVDAGLYPVTDTLNREMLTVSGLADGRYQLKADGKVIGTFSAAQLAKGINLALLATPSRKIADEAAKVNGKRHQVIQALRGIKQTDIIAAREKGDPANLESAVAAAEKWLAKQAKSPHVKYYTYVVNKYKKDKPDEAKFRKQLPELTAELYKTAKPRAYELAVIPVK